MIPEKFGRYEIKSELGRGGMAIVYLAHDPRFDRDVAIKVLPREFLFDPQFHVRFEREIKTVAQLEHPAIVPVHDVGEEDGQPYFVMRYMTGGSLSDWLKQGKVSLQNTARIVERLARGLAYAHSKGIIHRDLKPGNILFDSNNDACISDFGVAKLADAASSMTGSGVIGTPAYMSPEQAQSTQVDFRTDIYSMGSIVYEMLTGHQPYKADTPMSVIIKHINEPVPEIKREHPEFSEEVDEFIKKSMHKDPEQRYGSMIELARALNKAAFGEEGHLTELPVTRPAMTSPATVIANSMAPTLAPNSTPLVTTPPTRSTRNWIGYGLGALAIILIIGLGFMLLRQETAEGTPSPIVEASQTAFVITATPLPLTDTPIPLPTETLIPPTATLDFIPVTGSLPITPNGTHNGDTQSASQLYYFQANEGQVLSLVLVGQPRYQTFSLRNSDNKGLVGCEIKSQSTCLIEEYTLPYTGVYYILVDRTFVDNYKQLQSCVTNPPYAEWCFRGGPFSLTFTLK